MNLPRNLRVFGLTGGIGAGKGEVARVLRWLGIPVLDADRLAREQLRPGHPVFDRVLEAFGPRILNETGQIDRQALASLVFSDPQKLALLNTITHPPLLKEAGRRLATLAEMGIRLAVIEAALLVESGIYKSLHGLAVVTAPEEQRIARVMVRDRITEAEVRLRMRSQASDEERARLATWLISNAGSLESLHRAALQVGLAMIEEARKGN